MIRRSATKLALALMLMGALLVGMIVLDAGLSAGAAAGATPVHHSLKAVDDLPPGH